MTYQCPYEARGSSDYPYPASIRDGGLAPGSLPDSDQAVLGVGAYVWPFGGFYSPYWHYLDGAANTDSVGGDVGGNAREAEDRGVCPPGEEGHSDSPYYRPHREPGMEREDRGGIARSGGECSLERTGPGDGSQSRAGGRQAEGYWQ